MMEGRFIIEIWPKISSCVTELLKDMGHFPLTKCVSPQYVIPCILVSFNPRTVSKITYVNRFLGSVWTPMLILHKIFEAVQPAFLVTPSSNLEHVHRNTWKILTRKAASFETDSHSHIILPLPLRWEEIIVWKATIYAICIIFYFSWMLNHILIIHVWVMTVQSLVYMISFDMFGLENHQLRWKQLACHLVLLSNKREDIWYPIQCHE